MDNIVVDCRSVTVYEAYMLVLTYMAYPLASEAVHHSDLHAALCQYYLAEKAVADANWASSYQPIKPCHAFLDESIANRARRTFTRRLNDRMAASVIGLEYVRRSVTADNGTAESTKPWSLNQASIWFSDLMELENAENVESRFWRASRPVIHLACALNLFVSKWMKSDGQVDAHRVQYPMLFAISSFEQLTNLLDLANEIAGWLKMSKDLRLPQNALLNISLRK